MSKWKQPIAYFLSSGPMTSSTMKNILLNGIEKLKAVGLTVKLVICDQGSNNQSLFVELVLINFVLTSQKYNVGLLED